MRIEEKEYTKSIDISIWKKVFPFLAPRKNVLIMVIVMNICLLYTSDAADDPYTV